MLLLGQRRTFFPLTLANVFSFGDMDRTLWRRLQCPSHLLSFCAQRRTLQRTQEKNPLGMELNKDLNAIQTKRPLLQRCSNSSSNTLSWKFALGLQEFARISNISDQLESTCNIRILQKYCCRLLQSMLSSVLELSCLVWTWHWSREDREQLNNRSEIAKNLQRISEVWSWGFYNAFVHAKFTSKQEPASESTVWD